MPVLPSGLLSASRDDNDGDGEMLRVLYAARLADLLTLADVARRVPHICTLARVQTLCGGRSTRAQARVLGF